MHPTDKSFLRYFRRELALVAMVAAVLIALACSARGETNKAPRLEIHLVPTVTYTVTDTNAFYTLEWCDDLVKGVWSRTSLYDFRPTAPGTYHYSEHVPVLSPSRQYRLAMVPVVDPVYSYVVPVTASVETNGVAETLPPPIPGMECR